jgi:uncharacterized protein (TIGR02217 family)
MAFLNVRLPVDVAFGTMGGPMRRTEVVIMGSGFEERNAVWANSRRKYNAGYGLRKRDDIATLIAFFEDVRGRLNSFRMKDLTDYKSCLPSETVSPLDQAIGEGDGVTTQFQLVKSYGLSNPYLRPIYLPITATVRVALDGVEQTQGVDYTVGNQTGIILFAFPPTSGGTEVTAGFEFDVPVRFDTDHLAINLAAWDAGEAPDVPLIEVRI